MKKIKLKSPAKINLVLEVIKKLSNGFHEVRFVMLKTPNLFDEIEIIFDEKKEEIKIFCTDKNIPTGEKNIVYQIAEKFFQKTGRKIGLEIRIKKRIPALAGLGGGSSNGASVLLALNEYFGNVLSFNELVKLASEVGKDIPFFLPKEKIVLVGGMGEKLHPIKKNLPFSFLIINPNGEISTAEAYGKLDEKLWIMGNSKRKNISQEFIKSINAKSPVLHFYNDFEIVAEERFPEIKIIKNALLSLGAAGTSLTGKGPTVFGAFKNKKVAEAAGNILRKKYPKFFVELG